MTSPHYKLTYFNGRGRAEIIRLVFTAAGIPFEDHRIAQEALPSIRASLPFGQVPILEIDSKIKLSQSLAIARYLAKKYGLAGKRDLDQIRVDMIVDCMEDILSPMRIFRYVVQDPVKQEELKKKYVEEELPEYLTKLETLLVSNEGGNGYFVGDELTWADLNLVQIKGRFEIVLGLKTAFDKHFKLKALYERVVNLPRIAEYQAKQPVTEF